MHQSIIKAVVLISFLFLCMPITAAAGNSTGSSDIFKSQDMPDFSSCESTNSTVVNPYCPIWDGEHTQPDPFLVYEFRKKTEESKYGISSLQPPPGWRGLPTKGTVRIPVFLVDFSDALHDPNQTVADVEAKMFGDGNSSDYPYESLKNYYQRSSYNQLTITGNVFGWYRANYTRAYYESLGKPQGRIALINEILLKYDSQVDFSVYDADHNGKMDAIFIKWAGSDNDWANFWWASMSTTNSVVTVDGVTPNKYVWSWYSNPNGGVFHPQVDIHETGHLLGLPDYYDYDPSTGPKGGVGGWDMMDYNWGDHNAFSKYLLGWIDPIVISSGTHQIILPPSGTSFSNNALLIMPGAVPDSFGEFFLVQYREPGNGNDPLSEGPGKAVWIWHVDSTLTSDNQTFLYGNSYTDHKLLRLMEADGLEELEAGKGYLDVHDFYIPGKALGPATVPNTNKYSGSITNVAVTNIQQFASSMQMDFSIPFAGPSANFAGNPLSGTAPLDVTFTDSSSGSSIINRSWDFGDGNISNYAVATNPLHRYTSAGTYTVNLTVTNTSGSNSLLRTNYVIVTAPPVAGFSANITSGTTPLSVKFTDNSTGTGISAWKWDFNNDTIIDSNSQNPTYTYASLGSYTVNLTVTGTAGTDSEIKSQYITVTPTVINPTDTVGIYRNGMFYLKNSNSAGNADMVFGYGLSTDTPLVGDWNGDRTNSVGIYRNGMFYLKNSNAGGNADMVFGYGLSTDTPLVGDWNGDRADTVGIYRNGAFYLKNSNAGGNADMVFGYGLSTDTPLVGDWDGDGNDTVGIYRNGMFYLKNSNAGGNADLVFGYGLSTDTPLVGDWNGDGSDTIGIYRNGMFYLRNSNAGGNADQVFGYGLSTDTPLVGDWNGL